MLRQLLKIFVALLLIQLSYAEEQRHSQCCSHPVDAYPLYVRSSGAVQDTEVVTTKAKIQRRAPHFEGEAVVPSMKSGYEFQTIKLSDYAGKYVVLLFYPLDFTFVCPTEIIAFSDRVAEFRALNTEIIAVSVDSKYTHLAWVNTPRSEGGLGHTNIPILSDITKRIAEDYGVLLPDDGVALRGLFIIDGKGVLRQITVNDLPVGRSVDETIRLIQAFQYTDQHGEVCPAGWQPGKDTIKPDPQGSKAFFAKQEL